MTLPYVIEEYGFLNYHIVFSDKYPIPNLPEDVYDKMMYF